MKVSIREGMTLLRDPHGNTQAVVIEPGEGEYPGQACR